MFTGSVEGSARMADMCLFVLDRYVDLMSVKDEMTTIATSAMVTALGNFCYLFLISPVRTNIFMCNRPSMEYFLAKLRTLKQCWINSLTLGLNAWPFDHAANTLMIRQHICRSHVYNYKKLGKLDWCILWKIVGVAEADIELNVYAELEIIYSREYVT